MDLDHSCSKDSITGRRQNPSSHVLIHICRFYTPKGVPIGPRGATNNRCMQFAAHNP